MKKPRSERCGLTIKRLDGILRRTFANCFPVYARETLIPGTKATAAEITAYLSQHPELDRKQTKAKANDLARDAVEQEKENQLIAEIVKRQSNNVTVADDFTVSPLP